MEPGIYILIFLAVFLALATGLVLLNQDKEKIYKILPHLVSVGTGLLLSICFTEFIPHCFKNPTPLTPFLIMAGFLFIILSEKYIGPKLNFSGESCSEHEAHCTDPSHSTKNSHSHSHSQALSNSMLSKQVACTSIGCIVVCAFFDGLQLTAGFKLHQYTGTLLSIGMLLHIISESALTTGLAIAGGLTKRQSLIGIFSVGLSVFLGAVTNLVLSIYIPFETYLLPFATGVLLYVTIGHLLPAVLNSKKGVPGLFFGALLTLLLTH